MAEPLANWGNYPRIDATLLTFDSDGEAVSRVRGNAPLIPRGLGRCYGDSALAETVLSTRLQAQWLDLDEKHGLCECDGGLPLGSILERVVPRGWFLPVVPGTRDVTVGGAIASDIHGKNHHRAGTFSQHVLWMDLVLPGGEIRRVTRAEEPDLFEATAGGMGLTGLILRACLRLVRIETAFVRKETLVAKDLEQAMGLFQESESWTYSVAWIDCQAAGRKLGRSILFRAEHAVRRDLDGTRAGAPLAIPARGSLAVPVYLPACTLNPWSVRTFNRLYYRRQMASAGSSLEGVASFFFPLDVLRSWNRIYGRRGFVQYQAVLPSAESEKGITALLERISTSGLGSFLAVLKLMGEGGGMLSFPLRGYTLALDFPASPGTFALFEDLDALVLQHGGRLYLTKDARMPRRMLDEGYPDANRFRELRRALDAPRVFESLQSRRLGL